MRYAPLLFSVFVVLFFSSPAFAGTLEILRASNASTVPGKVYASDLVTLSFDITNDSGVGQAASDIIVSIELNENDFEPIKVSDAIGEIRSRGSKTVSLRFRARETVLPGHYTIPVHLDYQSGNDAVSEVETVSFDVSSCNFLNIQDIELSNEKPHIGSTLEVTAVVKNTCSNAARNVSAQLKPVTNSTIEPFIVGSGTYQKIGDILPGESRAAVFFMTISDKVEAKTYVFAVDANCDSCVSTSNPFSFLVLGEPELVFSNIEYSVDNVIPGASDKQILPGSTFVLSVQLDNIGEEKAKAVSVEVDFGDSFSGTQKAFLGNVDPDDSGAAIFNLAASYAAASGSHDGSIIITYIDELGVERTITEDYSLFIAPAEPVSPVVYVMLLIMVAVVLGIIYFIIKFVFRQLAMRKSK